MGDTRRVGARVPQSSRLPGIAAAWLEEFLRSRHELSENVHESLSWRDTATSVGARTVHRGTQPCGGLSHGLEPPALLHQVGRARCRLDADCFLVTLHPAILATNSVAEHVVSSVSGLKSPNTGWVVPGSIQSQRRVGWGRSQKWMWVSTKAIVSLTPASSRPPSTRCPPVDWRWR